MKTVVLVWWRRPRYSRLVAEALCRCRGVEDYRTIVHVEPGCDEVVRLAREFPLPNKRVVVRGERLGCTRSIHAAMADGFAGSDYVVCLEDDVVPAPDCLLYFEWARRRYAGDPAVLTVGATHDQCDGSDAAAVFRGPAFTCWGWATWRDRWAELDRRWPFGDRGDDGRYLSWDSALHWHVRGDRLGVWPRLARTQNIGAEGGTHATAARHGEEFKRRFNWVWAGDRFRPPVGQFVEREAGPGSAGTEVVQHEPPPNDPRQRGG